MDFIFFLVRARPRVQQPLPNRGFQGGPTEPWNWSGQGPARWETMGPRDPGGAPRPHAASIWSTQLPAQARSLLGAGLFDPFVKSLDPDPEDAWAWGAPRV